MPIDTFLRSLAADQQGRSIGIILSGTNSDGALGIEAVKSEGGITLAQDEKSAKFDGMPRAAVATRCVDFVLPPEEIAGNSAASQAIRTSDSKPDGRMATRHPALPEFR